MEWGALATIVTAAGALGGSLIAVRNSQAARREGRDQSYVQSAEKRAAAAEARAAAAERKLIDIERRAAVTELRAERAEWRLARLEQNEQRNELDNDRLSTAARSMASWIYMVVAAAERNMPADELRRVIDSGPPEALPFRGGRAG